MTAELDLSNYRLVFSDEFDSFRLYGQPDGLWRSEGYWGTRTLSGNNEKQLYVDPAYKDLGLNPFSVADGVLTIRAEPTPAAVRAEVGYDYTSGMISSERSFSMQYGYFEIRAQMPEGQGLWPAFWALTLDGQWPPELDVVEVLGHEPDKLYGTSHYKDADGKHKIHHAVKPKGLFDSSDGFHTYGMDWQTDKVVWYYDGIKVGESENRIFNQSVYLIANLAVGGSWPGNPDASTPFPADLKIDYIRAYQRSPDHQIVSLPTNWEAIGIGAFTVLTNSSPTKSYSWRYTMGSEEINAGIHGDGSRFLTGNDKNNFLAGSSTSYNELDGRKGDDTLQGGRGSDTFVIRNGNGNDTVLDFGNSPGNTDKIRLDGFHFRHADDVLAWSEQVGTDVILRLDEDQALLLKNVRLADLTPDIFIFTNSVEPPTPTPSTPSIPPVVETPPAGPKQPHPRSETLEYKIRESGTLWKSYEQALADAEDQHAGTGIAPASDQKLPLSGEEAAGQSQDIGAAWPSPVPVLASGNTGQLPAGDLQIQLLDHGTVFDKVLLH